MDPEKEKKVSDRIIAHQLIILENTNNRYIESINIKSSDDDKKGGSSIKLTEMSSAPSTMVKPSSLNYKISLNEATNDFVKKEMSIQDD